MKRLVYASSVAAYGFHRENPQPLTEEVPARGTAGHYYSAQKAEVERCSATRSTVPPPRPTSSVPASSPGRDAPLLIDSLPYTQISERLPGPCCACSTACRSCGRCCPIRACPSSSCTTTTWPRAMRAAVLGRGTPGIYNLAGPGQITVKQLAQELGWYSIPVPELAVDAVAEMVGRLGFLPAQAQWICGLSRARDHGHGEGAPRASLAPQARRAADAARDDRRRALPLRAESVCRAPLGFART